MRNRRALRRAGLILESNFKSALQITVTICLAAAAAGCVAPFLAAPVPASDPETLITASKMAAEPDTASAVAAAATSDPAAAAAEVAVDAPDEAPEAVLRDYLQERPDLAQLDDLYRQCLRLMAGGNLDPARDILILLRDEAAATVPADDDSLAAAFLGSLERRASLLAGVLAEQSALRTGPAGADSLLDKAYADIRGFSFPDSLVPLSGPSRRAVEADLLRVEHDRVAGWIEYFTGNGRTQMRRWLDRKTAAEGVIYPILDRAGLPRELIYLAMIESGLSSAARSSVGAVGPWQFMPGTARHFRLRCDWWVDERRDLGMATEAAATYLTQLYARFGDWALVLAAYNAGEGRVERAIRLAGKDDFWTLRLPWQTRNHIPKFIAAARIGADPAAYGFEPSTAAPLAYDVIDVTDATDLGLIAECADAPAAEVARLNPGLLRGATPPGRGDYPVRVPAGTGKAAMRKLRRVPRDQRLTWRRHVVAPGETTGGIALAYGTTVSDIARINRLRDVAMIHPGDKLLIPMPAELAARAQKRITEKGYYVPPEGYDRVSYRVKKGDTLGGIARKLGVTLTHIRKVNNIHGTSLIRPGQRIYAYRPGS